MPAKRRRPMASLSRKRPDNHAPRICVKIEPRQIEAFLKKPDPKVRGVVVYGNDDGLIAERAVALAKTVCEDLKDPFRVVDIAGDVLKGDPARLADEFGAMSMLGGRRVIRVRPAGEESAAALENLAAAPAGDALVVIEGGNLTPRSSLRALAETEACLAALPCYMDNEAALEGLAESAARARGLGVDPDAPDRIVERLGGGPAGRRPAGDPQGRAGLQIDGLSRRGNHAAALPCPGVIGKDSEGTALIAARGC